MLEREPGIPEGLTYPGVSPTKGQTKSAEVHTLSSSWKGNQKGARIKGFFNLLAVVL